MKNSELLQTPKHCLTGVDRQRQYVLEIETRPSTCPACRSLVSIVEASGQALDDYDVTKNNAAEIFTCPRCDAKLKYIIPLFGPPSYLWELAESELRPVLHPRQ